METAALLLEDWELSQLGSGRSTLTTSERIRVLTQFVSDMNIDPLKATPRDISRWFARRRTHWSPSTRATYHSYFCAFYKWAARNDLREDNPMTKLDAPRMPRRTPRPISKPLLMRLLATPMRDKTRRMILLAAFAGLRVHEIAKIRGEDVDIAGRMITVCGKGDKVATIPMHDVLVELALLMPRKGFWFESPARPGECLYSQSVSQIIGNAMRRGDIPGTPHALRHTFASNLLLSGADLLVIKELLRHESIGSTQIYTLVPNQLRIEAVNRLDHPFGGSSE